MYRRAGDNEKTADAALNAVSRIHRSPMAHFNLGVALARSGDPERAEVAFQTALKFRPNMAAYFLADVLESERKLAEALVVFEELANRFPESCWASEARARLVSLRTLIDARKL